MGVLRSLARGTALAGAIVAGGALVVTARSVLATPQPLASALEGESHIFRFRNGDVFYKVRGPIGAQPILLLHSIHLSASSFEWRKNFSALSQSFRVYAPDLPGFGLSDRPEIDYTPDVYIQCISDFAREVIARPVMVVARGQSAVFATRAAHLDEQLFSRLVFISPSGILHTPPAERQAQPAGTLRGTLRRLSETSLGQVPYAFLTTRAALSLFIARQSYTNPEHITPDVVQQLFATTHQFGARYAPLAFMTGKLDADVTSDFAALRQPVLLVWGEQDAINPPTTSARALGKLNPHARLELINTAGNAVQDEQASEINELLRAWFLAPPELVDPLRTEQAQPLAPPEPPAESAELFTQRQAQSAAETAHQAPAAPAPASAEPTEQVAPAAQAPATPAAPKAPPRRAAQRRPPSKATTPDQPKPGKAAQPPAQPEDTRQASPDTEHKPPRPSGGSKKKK